MKKICFLVLSVLLLASGAFAADPEIRSVKVFDNHSGSAGVAVYSSVVNVSRFPQKSVMINGGYNGGTFGNYTGTVLLQCGPTVTGPWQTCKDAGNNAVTSTANAHFNLSSTIQYLRASWTKTKHRVTVWLNYQAL